jgi:hypothetical protein
MLMTSILAAALALAAPSDVLVVVNQDASTVSVISLETGATLVTLPTGVGPHEAAASDDGRLAVVTNYGAQQGGNSLTVVDLGSLSVARTVDLGEYRRPHGIVFLPDNRRVAVTSETSGMVLVVDVTTGRIVSARPTAQEGSHMVVAARDGRRAFTANIRSGSMTALDLDSGEPRSAPGQHPDRSDRRLAGRGPRLGGEQRPGDGDGGADRGVAGYRHPERRGTAVSHRVLPRWEPGAGHYPRER